MEDLLDSIYIYYDDWTRLWILGLFIVCGHWGYQYRSDLNENYLFFYWFVIMIGSSFVLLGLVLLRVYDQFYRDDQFKHLTQKWFMFVSGPFMFIVNWASFFILIDQLIDLMPYSMAEWCFLLGMSLYNTYSFLLIHFSKTVETQQMHCESLN